MAQDTSIAATQNLNRRHTIVAVLSQIFGALFGKDPSELDANISLIEMGADSLFLLQVASAIQDEFKIKVPFRLLLEDLSTMNALATHLDCKLPANFQPTAAAQKIVSTMASVAEQVAAADAGEMAVGHEFGPPQQPQPAPQPVVENQSAVAEALQSALNAENIVPGNDEIHAILTRQLALMSQQLAVLTAHRPVLPTEIRTATHTSSHTPRQIPVRDAVLNSAGEPSAASQFSAQPVSAKSNFSSEIEPEVFVPYEAIETQSSISFSEKQRKHLASLISRVNQRTATSKRLAQQDRYHHADNRAVAGFRMAWKELVYPLLIERGEGSHIWDVDGNEYIDMTMGFGALLFGHSPPFIIEALEKQLKLGIQLGPHSRDAGEAARLICEMTGVERVAFCNSGTEAVMTALRLARTVTGRTKIALFEGCYHGTFDGIMAKGAKTADGRLKAIPLAPGVPEHMIENVLMLKYNDPESLDLLRAHAHELAAVLIEPPRSRRPDVQPKSFLQELRRITQAFGAALIFDEVVTGFRFHPGGAQAMYDIRADLVTYGKAIGGGLPIAVIAGNSKFMDAVDGGMWSYGDNSYPEADITFFAGTYFKHPLIMPAVVAALRHIQQRGIELQESLNAKAQYVTEELGAFFKAHQLPLRVAQLGSLFRILYGPELKHMDLLFYHLLEKGIYVCETHNFLLSTAHTDADIRKVVQAIEESIQELREGGFLPQAVGNRSADLPGMVSQSSAHAGNSHPATEMLPLTESQRQIWAVSHMGDDEARAYNLGSAVEIEGSLDVELFRECVDCVVGRHEALRARFGADGDFQTIASFNLEMPLVDLSFYGIKEQLQKVAEWRWKEASRDFDFIHGPLFSFRLLRLKPTLHVLLATMHHIISDGWSIGIILSELQEIYSARKAGAKPDLPVARSFAEYVKVRAGREKALQGSDAESFWIQEFPDSIPAVRLPVDFPAREHASLDGVQKRVTMPAIAIAGTKEISRRYGCTSFMVQLAMFNIFLSYLTQQEDIVVGVPAAGQGLPDGGYMVGCCVNLLALRTHVSPRMRFPELLLLQKRKLLHAYEYQDFPFNVLLKRLRAMHPDHPAPAISVIFNADRAGSRKDQREFTLSVLPNHNQTSKFDLTVDLSETGEGLIIDFEYKSELFSPQRIASWMELLQKLVLEINDHPEKTVEEFFTVLKQEETSHRLLITQELTRQEHQRFANAKRKAIAPEGVVL